MAKPTSKPWPTADGKKDLTGEMAAAYHPLDVEEHWYEWWEKSGFFRPRSDFEAWGAERVKKEGQFTICLPPPNVTGSLHIGHALTNAVQDAVVRWRRMRGENVLWVPGTDHAGIATQVVVEKKLKRDHNLTRHDLGREKFVEKVWEWKHEYASTIHDQLKKTASSLDWTREFFTMDEPRAVAVTEAFVTMHENGVIERSTRLVNWCVALQSAISDLEVDHKEFTGETNVAVPGYEKKVTVGLMYNFYYIVEGTNEKLEIATTRPETILGDSAIAIHPEDKRYKHLHGKRAKCPFRDETIPIVLDSVIVDMEKGTGVVKITPAHDPNDFECGKRHKLPEIIMMSQDGNISAEGEFKGMKRYDARKAVVEALKKRDLFAGTKPWPMSIGCCQRTGDIVEKYLMPQWFVVCKDAATRALQLEKDNVLQLIPKRHGKIWHHWLNDIHPWCISRQLWWGHRIPAYACYVDGKPCSPDAAKNWVSGRNLEEAKTKAQKAYNLTPEQMEKLTLEQDEDVLDTWFSSGLLPHSALGWPNQEHPDFKQFFPTQLLETGHDILFFWVARMVMTSLIFLDKLPFDTVYLHAMVRDKEGRKMSKSLGNVVDPLDVRNGISLEGLYEKLRKGNLPQKEIERAEKFQLESFGKEGIKECGSDALRLGLLANTSSGSDVNLDIKKVIAYRHFCNKLWQGVKFAAQHLGADYKVPDTLPEAPLLTPLGTPFKAWAENDRIDELTKTLRSRCSGVAAVEGEKFEFPFVCHWILSRLDLAVTNVNKHFFAYEFSEVVKSAHAFWYEFFDYFLEMTKPIMNGKGAPHLVAQKEVFKHCLFLCIEVGLRLLHPILPFTTEELWNRLPGNNGEKRAASIMIADFPSATGWHNEGIEDRFAPLQGVIHAIRSMKSSYQIPQREPDVYLVCDNDADIAFFESEKTFAISMGRTGKITVVKTGSAIPDGCAAQVLFLFPSCAFSIVKYMKLIFL